MMTQVFLILVMVLALAQCKAAKREESEQARQDVRPARWAGSFYPADAGESDRMLNGFLANADPWDGKGRIVALISPHAGYVYSGQTAGSAYKAVQGLPVDVVVIVARAHRVGFQGVSVTQGDGMAIPGRVIAMDREMADRIRSSDSSFGFRKDAEADEHSIEVMIPFIAKVLPEAKVVPILIGQCPPETTEKLAEAIVQSVRDRKVLLVASTDLSHFPESDETATKVDTQTLESWKSLDIAQMTKTMDEQMSSPVPGLECTMCGAPAVFTVVSAAKRMGADSIHIFPYSNSARAAGTVGRTVGYGSAVLFAAQQGGELMGKNDQPSSKALTWEDDYLPLAPDGQKEAIEIARGAIEAKLDGRTWDFKEPRNPQLKEARGCFVTLLFKENDELKGCIGVHETTEPLYKSIAGRALNAAFGDPRFPPLSKAEWSRIKVKVSIYLSGVKPISDPDLFEPGRFGIIFEKGPRASTFLPEVALEQGWSKTETFEMLARKAGLRADDWQGGKFSLYTTQVISEEDPQR